MSLDHALVVRSRKRSFNAVRAALRAVLAPRRGAALAPPEEGDEDEGEAELRVMLPGGGGGTISVRRLRRGFELGIDSSSGGARESFIALGEVMEELAAKLGKVVEGEEAEELLDEEDADAGASPLADVAEIALLDLDGRAIERAQASAQLFAWDLLPGGMLKTNASAHPLLLESARFERRGARLVVTLHSSKGAPFRCYDYELDGYGRVRSFTVTEL